jgi:hypothetical protein
MILWTKQHTTIYGEHTMVNFATLKKSSGSIDRLAKELEKLNAPASDRKEDDRFWRPEVDKSGNGMAVIRFLPAPAVDGDEGLPWVRVFNHGFKGPSGKWYIENSLTTLNQKDPVSEYNSQLWNASSDESSPQRKQARAQKRKLSYISNILVISDPKNPQNEGQVKLFRYGKKIFDKISMLMNPEFEGDEKVNPFDFWAGANFKLRMRTVDGYPNYDQSTFESPSVLNSDDAKLEQIWKSQYSLKEFVDAKNFKSYDELKKRLNEVLELNEAPVTRSAPKEDVFASASKRQSVTQDTIDVDEDDDDLKQFKALAG